MSPRRMDISLLRDPSPHNNDRPALPASLLTILNSPRPQPRPHPPPPDHQPFLGLDALVHAASEERRRIAAASPDDHDRHARHDSYPPAPAPLHHHLDLPSPPRPHKRPWSPSPPRSPSPAPGFPLVPPQSTSPSTRHHPSASPASNYPTLRPQPVLHIEPTRSAPALLPAPPLSLQRTSPFSHSPQSLTHSSPRNNSPHRHSPQLLRSHHHSPPLPTSSFVLPCVEPDAMSPRYGYGPRMAGGIDVLSNDPSPVRDLPRPDFSFYQSPKRDLSTERLVSESHAEHARHELQHSPLLMRPFSLDDDRRQVKPPSHRVEAQECVFPCEQVRSRHSHFPFVDTTTDNAKSMTMSDFPAQHPLDRHPIRLWEEQPTARETLRRVSPARILGIASGIAEVRTWSSPSESVHHERPASNDFTTVLRQDVVENVPTSPLIACKAPPPPRHPTPEPLTSDLQTPIEGTHLDSQPPLPMPVRSESQTHRRIAYLNSLSSPMSASPVFDLPVKNFETQPELRTECSEAQVDVNTEVLPTSSDPIVTEPVPNKEVLMHVGTAADTSLVANPLPRQPSLEPVRLVESGTFETSTHATHASPSQSTSRSPSQQPLPAKDEHSSLPEGVPITPSIQPDSASRQSSEPEHTSKREPSVSEQAMMDVDEELLSLVEDRPARAVPMMPKAQIDSKLSSPSTIGQATGTSIEQSSQASDGPSRLPSSQPVLKGLLMTDEEKDRASMPPPAARNRKAEKDKTAGSTTGNKRKKDGTSKTATKLKQPPKPRAKPAPKHKVKPNAVDPSPKAGIPKSAVNVDARSRSTSVIPCAVDDVVPEPEPDDSDKEDDKLYCVCKTRYDEDRMMIACDRCDEWFHTLCVNIPDLEVDLVDQFICPPCMQKHPHLRTTWKRRCLFGLQHENPSSSEACHKPSRGVFSKYCSDVCGKKSMRVRIAQWEKSGGMRDLLWECVKNAPKREGVVVCTVTNAAGLKMDVDSNDSGPKPLDSAAKRRAEREVARLNVRLEEVVKERELMKRELDMVMWRKKVVELASTRVGKVDECGWDQRLCFGEEEWTDFGQEVLESYEEERVKVESGDNAMPLDAASVVHGEWWCTGKKKCERHAGWQKLRAAEVSFDKETKEGILLKLTTREREIRKCIEDILYPQPTGTLRAPSSEVQLNGSEKPPTNHVSERGKKRSS